MANPDMFQTAYQQITPAERAFVDNTVQQLAEAAQHHHQPIRTILNVPLPAALHARDPRGWLKRPLVLAAITEQINHLALHQDINLDNVVRELHTIAHARISDFYDVDEFGDPMIDMNKLLDPSMSGAVKSIEFDKSDALTRSSRTKVKLTMHDKIAALNKLVDLLGDEAHNPYRYTAERATNTGTLTDATAATEYAKFIGDD